MEALILQGTIYSYDKKNSADDSSINDADIVHQNIRADGNTHPTSLRDLHPATDKIGFVSAHGSPTNRVANK
jgi:hypothetical protein